MARRPNAPKPRQSTRRPAPAPTPQPEKPAPTPRPAPAPTPRAEKPAPRPERPARTPDRSARPERSAPSASTATSARSARSARSAASAASASSSASAQPAPSAPSAHSAVSAHSGVSAHSPSSANTAPPARSRSVGRARPSAEVSAPAPAPATGPSGEGRVVQAAERFRELVVGRPWRRRRRAIIAGVLVTALVLVAAGVTAIFLPALQIQQIQVEGTGYLEQEEVQAAVQPHTGGSILLLPTGRITQSVAEVPGVDTVEVERSWPDGVRVSVTEIAPIAQLTTTDGSTTVIGAEGQQLPAAAGEGASLVPLTVGGGAGDPEGAAQAMAEVLAGMPEPLRGAVQEMTASSASDVTVVLALEDGGTKEVVWGDAQDAELKAEVVQALLGQPGTVIDVSSPVAPVTR